MILSYATLIVLVIILALIIAFLYIRDKQYTEDMRVVQEAILEVKNNTTSDETTLKEDTAYKELDSKIYELGESLIKIVRSIKNLDHNQKELIQRVEKIEEQLKLSMLASSSNSNEKEILNLYKEGKSAQEIAMEKNIPLGEVEFIIKLANLNDN